MSIRTLIARPRMACRSGLTLVEILVATTLSLLLILAIAEGFARVSTTISGGRSRVEIAERMRVTLTTLTSDVDTISVPALPILEPAKGVGYLEITEGWARDFDNNANGVADVVEDGNVAMGIVANGLPDWREGLLDTSVGDYDDILAMTVINRTTPFVGYVMGTLTPIPARQHKLLLNWNPASPRTRTQIISDTAEIIWWTTLEDRDNDGVRDPGEYYRLHRRVLLVRPDIEIAPSLSVASMPPPFFFSGNDLSIAVDATGNRITNTLQDLSLRQRRTAHGGPNLVYPLIRAALMPQRGVWLQGPDGQWGVAGADDDGDGTTDGTDYDEAGAVESDDILIADNSGQDVILSHVLAFDIKVFDPLAPLKDAGNGYDLLAPDDNHYSQTTPAATATGDFVDLGYALNPVTGGLGYTIPFASAFSGPPYVRNPVVMVGYPSPTWDTWPIYYEMDGIDNPPTNSLVDEGLNGLDDNNTNGVDDYLERETYPPYSSPVRGARILIRCIDPGSQVVRQEHVDVSFRPE